MRSHAQIPQCRCTCQSAADTQSACHLQGVYTYALCMPAMVFIFSMSPTVYGSSKSHLSSCIYNQHVSNAVSFSRTCTVAIRPIEMQLLQHLQLFVQVMPVLWHLLSVFYFTILANGQLMGLQQNSISIMQHALHAYDHLSCDFAPTGARHDEPMLQSMAGWCKGDSCR